MGAKLLHEKYYAINSRLTELPIFARASLALSTLEGCLFTVNARAMCEQNSTDIPTACGENIVTIGNNITRQTKNGALV